MVLDSQHDFCEKERQDAKEGGGVLLEFYNVSGTNKVLKYMLSTSPDPHRDMLIAKYDAICCRADTENLVANEEFAEYLTCANDSNIVVANKGTNIENIAKITEIIHHFDYPFELTSNTPYIPNTPPVTLNGTNNIYLFCDAGPAIFKTLVEESVPPPPPEARGRSMVARALLDEWQKSYNTNLIHTLTPATLCDSAVVTRCQAFFNPTIFMRPPRPDGIPRGQPDHAKQYAYPSLSSLFGTTIHASSQEYNASGPNNMGLLYISGGNYEIDPLVMEDNVTSVPALGCNIIRSFHVDPNIPANFRFAPGDLGQDGRSLADNNRITTKSKDGRTRETKIFQPKFTYRQAFDIKRAADSDQVYHTYLIVQHKRRNGEAHFKYIFCTGDRICAYIAFHYYGLNTMYMAKNIKTYRLWKEKEPAYPELITRHGYINENGSISRNVGYIAPAPAQGGSHKNKSNRLPQHGGVSIYNASLNAWYDDLGRRRNKSNVQDTNIYNPTPAQLSSIPRFYRSFRHILGVYTDYDTDKKAQAFQIRQEAFMNILRACKDKLQDFIFEVNPKLVILASFYNIKINSSNEAIKRLLIDNHNNLYDCARINENVDAALVNFNNAYPNIEKIPYVVDERLNIEDIVNKATQNIKYNAHIPGNQDDDPLEYILKFINGSRHDRRNHSPANVLQILGVFGEIIDNSYNMESSLIFNYFFDEIHNKTNISVYKQKINEITDTYPWTRELYRTLDNIISQLSGSLTTIRRNGTRTFVYTRGGVRRTLKRRRNRKTTRKNKK